ncbi:MAG TPA: hypothetical protein VMV88_03145 [Gallionella sp.]|nr:hypothetical protein [Gallionella sp.]
MMTLSERGLLFSMLCECWANIEIPANPDELAQLLGKQKEVQGALTQNVIRFFDLTPNANFRSPDLEAYRKNVLEKRERMSEGGKKGGKQRAENEKKLRGASSHLSPFGQATLKGRETEHESEHENEPAKKADILDDWVNDYERASRGT